MRELDTYIQLYTQVYSYIHPETITTKQEEKEEKKEPPSSRKDDDIKRTKKMGETQLKGIVNCELPLK